ncbi:MULTISPECIES: DUF2808 domain-containing protein [Trichocoleus]|uniref:DUF2808 domain-containing protein n=1 Tax=Trichocoleus desertorum GB2-A4 TaxID=2933944 RepID=A0ABV0J6M7_9CYAN|nr:DUF2808 domain-containing protein [Trichocoleus sp. FACHB-46]MBD1863545.1 DUF2808 domain-containing protein [Trichocoleus sp. FACHB-46]
MKGIATSLGILLTAATATWSLNLPLQAVTLADGTVYFVQPPRLVKATTTQSATYAWSATYYFTLDVPENAGEPLQKVTIAQREGIDALRYDLKDTQAFVGEPRGKRQAVALSEVIGDRKTRTVSVAFDPPIPPGQTVTVGLRPVRNPNIGGVYLFGVTAFPAGEKAHGQFLGFGRLHFYDSRDAWFLRDRWFR